MMFSGRTGAAPGQPISFAQLKTAAASYGYTLEDRRNQTFEDLYALLNQKIAPILLVNAAYLESAWQGDTLPRCALRDVGRPRP